MNPPFTFRPRARLDLMDQFLYLADQATTEMAERYFAAVDQTCARTNSLVRELRTIPE